MRYLPLTPTDREQMLARIGVASIDDLFVDVPEAARRQDLLDLPHHQSELDVERRFHQMASKIYQPAMCRFFVARGLISTMCQPLWTILSNARNF